MIPNPSPQKKSVSHTHFFASRLLAALRYPGARQGNSNPIRPAPRLGHTARACCRGPRRLNPSG